ncbi:hypothetical protein [Streptomyces sp. MJP52]|uniref:hypothetical protein n=1 Tax=Streptomyces sp. MJP52 TaxID=2940555 RepID=UPI00247720D2|nr:hypothetical protein [Streptomyces sp. MJP52]MDH6226954.1 hypothetical protein [Streptomyces sp. MJP52]
MPAGYEDDPLAAVLNGDPPPPDADPAARAAHEAALADVRLIGGALRDIGDTLADAPAPVPLRPVAAVPRRRARRRAALVWAAGLATAAAAFTGVMYAGAVGGVSSGSSADAAKAAPEAGGQADEKAAVPASPSGRPGVACASLAVEGTVVSVRPLAEGHVRVVLEAERYWRPRQDAADAPTAVTVLPEDAREDLRPGTRALVVKGPGEDRWVTGDGLAAEREELDAAGPGTDGRACPPG